MLCYYDVTGTGVTGGTTARTGTTNLTFHAVQRPVKVTACKTDPPC